MEEVLKLMGLLSGGVKRFYLLALLWSNAYSLRNMSLHFPCMSEAWTVHTKASPDQTMASNTNYFRPRQLDYQ